jgi:hypothetical protein
LAELKESVDPNTPGILERVGRTAASGFGQGATGLLNLPVQIARGVSKMTGAPESENEKKLHEPNMLDEGMDFWKKFGEERGLKPGAGQSFTAGAGGGAMFGPWGMAAGGAGRVAGDYVKEKFGAIPGLVAEVGTGMAVPWMFGPKGLTLAEEKIRQAMEGTTKQTFDQAGKNAQLFQQTRAKSAGLADTLPGDVPLKALSAEVAGAEGGEALAQKLSGRKDDLNALTEAVIRRAGPEVSVGATANKTADAANAVEEGMRKFRSQGTGAHMEGAKIKNQDTAAMYRELLERAKNTQVPAEREAYVEIAKTLIGADKRFITNVQDISGQMKRLRDVGATPDASAAKKWTSADMQKPLDDLSTMLGEVSPHYRQGMGFYKDYTASQYGPMRESAVGAIRDKNPRIDMPTPGSRLAKITQDQSPEEIAKTMQMLGAGGAPLDEVAAAVIRQKLPKGSQNPSQTLYGQEGSLDQQRLAQVLASAGKQPNAVFAPARAADLLQSPVGGGFRGNDQIQSVGAYVAQPFASIKNAFNQAARKKNYEEMAEILKDPNNVKALKEIAMFDPTIRQGLTMMGGLAPMLTSD